MPECSSICLYLYPEVALVQGTLGICQTITQSINPRIQEIMITPQVHNCYRGKGVRQVLDWCALSKPHLPEFLIRLLCIFQEHVHHELSWYLCQIRLEIWKVICYHYTLELYYRRFLTDREKVAEILPRTGFHF